MNDDAAAFAEDAVRRARAAQKEYERGSQGDFDRACLAVGWALLKPENNKRLSQMAVEETGLGNAADKEIKNRRKTLGLLRDIRGQKTAGIIREDPARGITEISRPLGVVAALTPSTNPAATPANKTINALKCGNAIVLAPPPKGAGVGSELLQLMRANLKKIGAPEAVVQMLLPPSKAATARLCELADFIVATGSQRNVKMAAACETPALGVGAGNAAVIIDETANIKNAAQKIAASKTFDNATSCSSENHLIVTAEIYESAVAALQNEGGFLLNAAQKQKLQTALWKEGALNREMIARDIAPFARAAGLPEEAANAKFVMAEETGVGKEYPMSGEKLSLALTLYRAEDFAAAKKRAEELLRHQGAGHSVGIHTENKNRPLELGMELPACRVIVNQAHCFANGGSFDNALPFSLSMGCGSWGKNQFGENLNFRHFRNIVRVVRTIPPDEPREEDIFADYWKTAGKE